MKHLEHLLLSLLFFQAIATTNIDITIDNFAEPTNSIIMAGIQGPQPTVGVFGNSILGKNSPNILGGQRDQFLTVTNEPTTGDFTSLVKNNKWVISTSNDGACNVICQYDGIADGGSMALSTTGLVGLNGVNMGVDLTSSGEALGFRIDAKSNNFVFMNVFFESPDGSGCVADVTINASGVMKSYLVPFTLLSGCSLNNVGAIQIVMTLLKNTQLEIDLIATYDTTIKMSLRPSICDTT